MATVREHANDRLRLGGIVVNRYRGDRRDRVEWAGELRVDYAGHLIEPFVPEREVIASAASAAAPLSAYGARPRPRPRPRGAGPATSAVQPQPRPSSGRSERQDQVRLLPARRGHRTLPRRVRVHPRRREPRDAVGVHRRRRHEGSRTARARVQPRQALAGPPGRHHRHRQPDPAIAQRAPSPRVGCRSRPGLRALTVLTLLLPVSLGTSTDEVSRRCARVISDECKSPTNPWSAGGA